MGCVAFVYRLRVYDFGDALLLLKCLHTNGYFVLRQMLDNS